MKTASTYDAPERRDPESGGGSTQRATVLAWGALVWTVVAGTVLAFAQTGESVSASSTSNSAAPVVTYSTTSLLETEGWSVVPLLLVPVALTAIGLVGGRRARRRRLITGRSTPTARSLRQARMGEELAAPLRDDEVAWLDADLG